MEGGQQENVALGPKFVKPVQSLTKLDKLHTRRLCSFRPNWPVRHARTAALFVSVRYPSVAGSPDVSHLRLKDSDLRIGLKDRDIPG